MSDIVERLREQADFWLNGTSWCLSPTPNPVCMEAADEIERLRREIASEREAHGKTTAALRGKDEAMGILFQRAQAGGVDLSDLVS